MRMRTRPEPAETVGLRGNVSPDHNGKPAGGKRFKLPKLWGGQKTQPISTQPIPIQAVVVKNTTDGQQSPKEKEPKTGESNLNVK